MPENTSVKRVLIDRANRSMFSVLIIASSMLIFAGVSVNSLRKVAEHRSTVIRQKKTAQKTLASNDVEVGKLITAFKAFEGSPESVIRTAEKNSKVVLDSLPPEYDFPAFATSLEKILTDGGYVITAISGTDNEVSELDDGNSNPLAIEIPFELSAEGAFDKLKNIPGDLERSIRPIYIISFELTGTATEAKLQIVGKSYYQPGKNLDIRYKEVK